MKTEQALGISLISKYISLCLYILFTIFYKLVILLLLHFNIILLAFSSFVYILIFCYCIIFRFRCDILFYFILFLSFNQLIVNITFNFLVFVGFNILVRLKYRLCMISIHTYDIYFYISHILGLV